MQRASYRAASKSVLRGFTLIELLTVIAIIAILVAILFPIAGTVREQARASDCLTKMHQLWVSANVYKYDEGGFPPALMGYAETAMKDGSKPDGCDHSRSLGTAFGTDPDTSNTCIANASRIINGFLYPEQVKDSNLFHCPDNLNVKKAPVNPADNPNVVTIAYFPPKPKNWPNYPAPGPPSGQREWIGETLAPLCGTGVGGLTVDCFTEGPNVGKPKFYYKWDSYDIAPYIDPVTGVGVPGVFVRNYSRDWTGVKGATDLPNQLKYNNPPDDKTILTYCSWHQFVGKTGSCPAISMAGTAKKLDLKNLLQNGPVVYAQ
jgi:prepilin-type N-terminal cleavage/methylation domain-containing protein